MNNENKTDKLKLIKEKCKRQIKIIEALEAEKAPSKAIKIAKNKKLDLEQELEKLNFNS